MNLFEAISEMGGKVFVKKQPLVLQIFFIAWIWNLCSKVNLIKVWAQVMRLEMKRRKKKCKIQILFALKKKLRRGKNKTKKMFSPKKEVFFGFEIHFNQKFALFLWMNYDLFGRKSKFKPEMKN